MKMRQREKGTQKQRKKERRDMKGDRNTREGGGREKKEQRESVYVWGGVCVYVAGKFG